jgi:DNA-binding FadR family transcriptional regulator
MDKPPLLVHEAPTRATLSAQVLESLVRAIVRSDYGPGDAFPPEAEIAEVFGVSRPTARETLKLLQTLGLVDIGHGRRTVVTAVTEWDVLSPIVAGAFKAEGRERELATQYWQLRHIVETTAAYLAATHATGEERAALRALVAAMEQSATAHDLASVLELDSEFHDLVGRASSNLALRRVSVPILQFLAWSSDSKLTVDSLGVLVEQHDRVAAAIAEGDGDAAAAAMDAHIIWAMEVESSTGDGLIRPARRLTLPPVFRSLEPPTP